MSAGGKIGMIPDRALNLELLDVSLRMATEYGDDDAQARAMLAVALRDHVTPKEAENKTKKVLTRVWVSPRDEARRMIRWGVEHQAGAVDRRALHYCALIAAFPFFGSIAGMVGRQIHLEGADRRVVRLEARAAFGEREFIDAATSKSLATLRNLALIDGPSSGPFTHGVRPMVKDEFTGWAIHALLLTRQMHTIGVESAPRSPELSLLAMDGFGSGYSLLAVHNETNRTVAEEV